MRENQSKHCNNCGIKLKCERQTDDKSYYHCQKCGLIMLPDGEIVYDPSEPKPIIGDNL